MKKYLLAFAIITSATAQAQNGRTTEPTMVVGLKDCIGYGLKHNPTVDIFRSRIEKSHQDAREALSGYLPQVNVTSAFDYNYKLQQNIIPAGVFGPTEQRITFGNKYQSNNTIQLDQKIYDQSLITGLKANKPNTELAEVNRKQNDEDIIYNISNSYYQILVNQKQLEIQQSNKERFEKLKRITQLQADYGVVKKIDVKQVEVNLSNVESQIEVTKNNIQVAQNRLKNNMGVSQETSLILNDTARWLAEFNARPAPGFDYTNTTQFQQQKLNIELNTINAKRIRDMAYPTVGLYARYGGVGFGNERIFGAYDPLLGFGSAGLKLNWNIFTGFRRDAQYKNAKLDVRIAELNLKYNEDQQNLQYQNANAQLNRTQINVASNQRNIELAQDVYDNTNLQYKEGVANLSDLLNAELSFREAQNNYTNSLIDYFLAQVELRRTNGTLFTYYQEL